MHKTNLQQALGNLSSPWQPATIGHCNGNNIMVVKAAGAYDWHVHPHSDDFFLVLQGSLQIDMQDCTVQLGPGDSFVVPKGIAHRPVAAADTHFLLIEPANADAATTTFL